MIYKLRIAFVLATVLLNTNSSFSLESDPSIHVSNHSFFERPLNYLLLTDSSFQSVSTDDTLYIKKRFWRASGELMLAQILPWAYNRYVRDAEFAKVTWESIGYNLKFSNWEWDDNTFITNQFAHPYQGSMYFSAFRSNGYSFWQSAPAAFVGSYMWEVAGETHPAAPNDLINTGLGGISLGEMTYRFSTLIVNNRQTGFKRQVNEVLALLINPMNGFNRIIDGRWGKVMPNIADRVPGHLSGTIDVGYRRISQDVNDVFTKGDNEFFVRAGIQYGSQYEDLEKPFSNFSLIAEFGSSDSATLNNLQVAGLLLGNEIKESDKRHHIFSVTMNYDYIKNTSIQYGGQSFTAKILADYIKKNNTHIYADMGIIGVAIAAVPDDYLAYGEGRNYDFGPGAGVSVGGKLVFREKLWFALNYKGIWFHVVNGNDADFYLNVFNSDLRYFINKDLSITLSGGYMGQNSDYADYEDVVRKYPFGRIGVGYTIGY